jgi:hypothetical protein
MKIESSSRCFSKVVAVVLVGVVAISGCGGSAPSGNSLPTEQAMKVSGKEELKKRLLSVAQSGNGGSGLAGMREAIGALKATDAALADQLLQDFGPLEQAEDAEQIKSMAQKMADKL